MKVRVNDVEIEIFEGAQVKDVIRKYALTEYKEVTKGKKVVVNRSRHQISLNGELSGQEEFYIIKNEEDEDA